MNTMKDNKYKNNGYIIVRRPDHPKAWSTGYIYEHRAVVEEHIGRFLEDHEIVHHINEDRQDNRIENLEITTLSEHAKQHGYKEAKNKILNCGFCNKKFEISIVNHRVKTKSGQKNFYCSRSCNGKANPPKNKKGSVTHGTKSGYSYWKCRCQECKDANTRRHREYRKRSVSPRSPKPLKG